MAYRLKALPLNAVKYEMFKVTICDIGKMNINMTIMVKNTNLNELYISSKEFEALNKCDSEIRYSYTLKFYEDGNSHPHNYKIEKSI